MPPSLVLINPWIYDFAAYDLWSKPLGLLHVGAFLRKCGFDIQLIDTLDVYHPSVVLDPTAKIPKRRLFGTGKFLRTKVSIPTCLRHASRSYGRYGISHQAFLEDLKKIKKPGAFLVTSLMTYWYPGVVEAISKIKQVYPDVPVILGGIYARLCHEHAIVNSGADHVVTENHPAKILALLNNYGMSTSGAIPNELSFPAYDLYRKIDYICIRTSSGCPYRCRYCASHFLDPEQTRRTPADVLEEILFWHRERGIKDFAFYDDALLMEADTHLGVILESVASLELDLRFHTPNAVHVREITPELARLMYRTGFRTIRLGLETLDFALRKKLDRKVSEGDFDMAVDHLRKAGYKRNEIGVYLLMGLPGQSPDSVRKTVDYVGDVGAAPYLAEYSPVPHTSLWDEAVRCSEYDLASEPLFHNNTLLPCWGEDRRKEIPKLKQRVLEIRHANSG